MNPITPEIEKQAQELAHTVAGKCYGETMEDAETINRLLNLPQLLADQAKCRELERDLEATGRVVLARDSTIDQLRAELALAEKCVEDLKEHEQADYSDCKLDSSSSLTAYYNFKAQQKE